MERMEALFSVGEADLNLIGGLGVTRSMWGGGWVMLSQQGWRIHSGDRESISEIPRPQELAFKKKTRPQEHVAHIH